MTRPDLTRDADIATVVHAFYRGMEDDPTLGPFFAGLDWGAHLPTMVAFWSSVVFHTGQYHGQPFTPHSRMPGLERRHFAAWLARFRAAVDGHFAGPAAERMKAKAEQIAGLFQVKLGLWTTLGGTA